ncbi:MAG: DUF6062 family protein [Anaerolineae bacterium]
MLSTAEMDIVRSNLVVAFEQPGCPACRLRLQAERQHLMTLLHEYVNDGATRVALVSSDGPCPRHAWLMQEYEQSPWDDGLKTSILLESVAARVSESLENYLGRPAPTSEGGGWRRGLAARLGRLGCLGQALALRVVPARAAADLQSRLAPSRSCPICENVEGRDRGHVSKLVRELDDIHFRALYATSDGLCLPHLRLALACSPGEESSRWLIQGAHNHLERLLSEVRSYMHKHRWQHRPELKTVRERASWIRLVAFLGSEAATTPEVVQRAREEALPAYRASPGGPEADP